MNKKRTFTAYDMFWTAIFMLVVMSIATWLGFIDFARNLTGSVSACFAFAILIALTGDRLDGSE